MNGPTGVQIIEQNGEPAFAVIPYSEYLKWMREEETIPHEVAGLVLKKGFNLAKAWRVHLGMTQKEVAKRAGISQSALSQMERTENSRSATMEKLAKALEISITQLTD